MQYNTVKRGYHIRLGYCQWHSIRTSTLWIHTAFICSDSLVSTDVDPKAKHYQMSGHLRKCWMDNVKAAVENKWAHRPKWNLPICIWTGGGGRTSTLPTCNVAQGRSLVWQRQSKILYLNSQKQKCAWLIGVSWHFQHTCYILPIM